MKKIEQLEKRNRELQYQIQALKQEVERLEGIKNRLFILYIFTAFLILLGFYIM